MLKARLRFTSRTAQQVREDLIAMIPTLAPSWTSHGEDEPGIALVEMLAGVADGLHYYFDKQALETFLPTVRLRHNAMSLSHLVGYRPRRTRAAQGSIKILTTQPLISDVYIPVHTQLMTQAGVGVVLAEEVFLPNGFSGFKIVPAVQGEKRTITAESSGRARVEIVLSDRRPSEQLFDVTTYGQRWVEFRDSQPEDPDNRWYHYQENVDRSISVLFLNELGNVPMAGTPITVSYLVSQDIEIAGATPLQRPDLEPPSGLTAAELENFTLSLERLKYETGLLRGYRNREQVSNLRVSAPVSIKTKNRAVSEADYSLLARQLGGVRDVKMVLSDFYTRQLVAYVLMEDAVEPDQGFLDEVQAFLNARNDLTLDVTSAAAPLQNFFCTVQVAPASGHTEAGAVYDAREALTQLFRTTAFSFGRTIRKSEIYSVGNSPESVSYIDVIALYWDGDPVGVSDLVPTSEVHVPHIGSRLTVSPVE